LAEAGIGDAFQRQTKYHRGHLPGGRLDWGNKPLPYKRYPSAQKIPLSAVDATGGPPMWDVISKRRSVRRFAAPSMAERDLSQLLYASQGTSAVRHGLALRTAPSAGALYPIETYVIANSVDGIEAGLYHYGVEQHELELLRSGDLGLEVAYAALDQEMALRADAVLVWTAVFPRSKWKYRQRAYRYVYLDAGHIAQNVALAAVALGLGSCQVAAIYDDEANALLGVDGLDESAIYMTVVGRPA
jgi:SagB-type dehydrogenase family enzyme